MFSFLCGDGEDALLFVREEGRLFGGTLTRPTEQRWCCRRWRKHCRTIINQVSFHCAIEVSWWVQRIKRSTPQVAAGVGKMKGKEKERRKRREEKRREENRGCTYHERRICLRRRRGERPRGIHRGCLLSEEKGERKFSERKSVGEVILARRAASSGQETRLATSGWMRCSWLDSGRCGEYCGCRGNGEDGKESSSSRGSFGKCGGAGRHLEELLESCKKNRVVLVG